MISYLKKKAFKVLFITLLTLNFNTINAQCFEIESILADACGSPEGENEMVRFKVGALPLNSNNISANWPSNSFLGICQNATTASVISSLNSSIISCGILIEPTSGILPANANVLLITSTAIDVSANSFANLSDTLYVIFQCAGNTGGHFANYNTSPGLRTLTISFSSPLGCTDVVTYDRTMLINQNGTTGGSTALKNGALANFDPAGNVTYDNQGCQAPFNPAGITGAALPNSTLTICPGDSINLFGTLTGPIDSVLWSGGFGNFNDPINDTTTYFSSINDTLPFYIKINGATTCSAGVSDSVLINIIPRPNISILEGSSVFICNGTSVTLNANGSSNYLWSTGATTNSINVTTQNNYFVTDTSNHCYTDTAFIQVTVSPQLTITLTETSPITLCNGDSVTLHANGASSYLWNTTANTDSITVNTTGTYFVYGNETCPSDTDSVVVNVIIEPVVSITEPHLISLCQGENITLHATGTGPFLWNDGSTFDSLTVNTADTFYVSTSNSCFTVSDTSIIELNALLTITITENGPIDICQGSTVTLHANGATNYLWNTAENTDSITVNTTGTYFVYGNETCPSDTDSVVVNVILPINLSIDEGTSMILCSGNIVTIHTSGNGTSFNWNNGSNFDSLIVNTIGEYWVTALNGICPSVSDTINIIDDIIPSASISGDTNLCIGSSIVLTASGNGSFSWSTGNTGSSTTVSSAQQVTLTSSNSCGPSITETVTITEEDCSIETGIIIPNVFTPNGDDFNDVFKVDGINITSITGSIYNRWGLLLFEWSGIDNGWNGEDYNEGTYFYIIKATFINEKTEEFKGAVLLLK